jgi:phosphoribosylanthranilate isomerase
MAVKVKVCGITSLEDAQAALDFGADMLGFNFYPPSPRAITPIGARRILARLPMETFNVALFVNELREHVADIIGSPANVEGGRSYRALQFHGDESAGYCRDWSLQVIKAVRLKKKAGLVELNDFPADYYLLDSWSAGYGGSGETFPWEWLDGCDAGKLILSGGLRVGNVTAAVRRIRPFAVDVCSGVESRPGVKDHGKLKDFIDAAKGA